MARAPGVWTRGRTDGYEKTEGLLTLAMDGEKETQDLKNMEREERREGGSEISPKVSLVIAIEGPEFTQSAGVGGTEQGNPAESTRTDSQCGREEVYRARKAIQIDRLLKTNTLERIGGG